MDTSKLKNLVSKDVVDHISSEVQAMSNAGGAIALTVTENLTIAQFSGLTTAITAFTITGGANLPVGAKVIVDVQQDTSADNLVFASTADTIVGAGTATMLLTGVASDRDVIELVWTGSEWLAPSGWFKVVDAA